MSVAGRVTVKNVGDMTADEVVQVYLNKTQMPDEPVPQLQLVNFTCVASISVSKLSLASHSGGWQCTKRRIQACHMGDHAWPV